ncbi:hypothetical protein [Wielerella bovis]|uniref:hypothetical protein n=1 Tax=Wielerella bovis TaxID=2917790 RepID=UPI002018BE97|nr:hypothetical protein [Wielerella bovis]ULJ66638.1 hypothetical protein MIS31_10375 [Wielerella bovis]
MIGWWIVRQRNGEFEMSNVSPSGYVEDNFEDGSFLDVVTETVRHKLASFKDLSDLYGAQLNKSLADIGNIKVDDVPVPERLNVPSFAMPTIAAAAMPTFTQPTWHAPNMPVAPVLDHLLNGLDLDVNWGDLPSLPDAPEIAIPNAPTMATLNVPVRPNVQIDVDLPHAPSLVLPDVPTLRELNLPDFEFPALPDFDGNAPSLDGIQPPDVFMNWHEPEYESELLPDLLAQVREMLGGGTGIPPEIEAALFNRARERESAETLRAVQEISEQWAARGFTLPQGALDKQIAAVREQGRLKATELNREILVQAATWEIENLRFAVQQGLALEQLTQNLFQNTVARLFEVAKFEVESQIAVFNARIGLFNAQVAAFGALVDVFKTRLEAGIAKITAYKAMLEAQATLGQLNAQQVDLFRAKLDGLKMATALYETTVKTAQIKAELQMKQFDLYRADVSAYAEQVNAEKVKFDAYDSRLRGEKTKADVFDSQVKAYAETVRAIGEQADVKVKENQIKISAAEAKIRQYGTQMDAYKAQLDTSLAEAKYQVQVFGAKVDAYKAQNSAAVAEAEVKSKYADLAMRTNIAYAEMQLSEYQTRQNAANQKAQIALESAKALGQYSAQLAAGALSAQHVSASMSAGYSRSKSTSNSSSTSTSHHYSY